MQPPGRAHDGRIVVLGIVGIGGPSASQIDEAERAEGQHPAAVPPQAGRRAEAPGVDGERLQNVRRDHRLVGLADDPFDRRADDDVAESGVDEPSGTTRRPRQRAGGHFGALLLDRPRVAPGRGQLGAGKVGGEPRLAIEEVVDRDPIPSGVHAAREVRKQIRQWGTPLCVAPLHQACIDGGSDGLTARADVPSVVRRHRVIPISDSHSDHVEPRGAVGRHDRGANRGRRVLALKRDQLGPESFVHETSSSRDRTTAE
jgi:hypothetical protein